MSTHFILLNCSRKHATFQKYTFEETTTKIFSLLPACALHVIFFGGTVYHSIEIKKDGKVLNFP